jgi:hypothetical protein
MSFGPLPVSKRSQTVDSLQKQLNSLRFKKDMKKDYYKYFPSIQMYKDIIILISEIKHIESKIKTKHLIYKKFMG